MPSSKEEIIIRGENGELTMVTASGAAIQISTVTSILAGAIHCTTADPASPVVGQIWFRTDV